MKDDDVACSDHYQNRMAAKLDGEDAALHELRLIADAAEADIVRDFPGVEEGYNLYAENVVIGKDRWPYATRKLVGVIDMGELYQQAFEWDGEQWNPIFEDAAVVRDLIIDQRTSR